MIIDITHQQQTAPHSNSLLCGAALFIYISGSGEFEISTAIFRHAVQFTLGDQRRYHPLIHESGCNFHRDTGKFCDFLDGVFAAGIHAQKNDIKQADVFGCRELLADLTPQPVPTAFDTRLQAVLLPIKIFLQRLHIPLELYLGLL